MTCARGGHEVLFEIAETVALGEAAGGGGRRIGGDDEAVPAPEVAFTGDEPLAGLQQRSEARAVGLGDEADLGEPAGKLRRGGDMGGERLDAFGKGGVTGGIGATPALGRGGGRRHVEVVAKRRAERRLEPLGDADRLEHWRPFGAMGDVQHLGEGAHLGVEALDGALGIGEGAAGLALLGAGAGMGLFGGDRLGLRRDEGGGRRLELGLQGLETAAWSEPASSRAVSASISARWPSSRISRSPASRMVRSSWLRRAVISASAEVASERTSR